MSADPRHRHLNMQVLFSSWDSGICFVHKNLSFVMRFDEGINHGPGLLGGWGWEMLMEHMLDHHGLREFEDVDYAMVL